MSLKMPQFKTGNASMRKALNLVAEYAKLHGINPAGRPGWNQTADGWMPPLFRSSDLQAEEIWVLNVDDADLGTVSFDCGTIIADASDLTDGITITNGTAQFNPVGGNWAYLKVTNLTTPAVELAVANDWTDFPSAYQVTGSGSGATYAAYYYPLYHFRSTSAAGYSPVNSSLYYRKLVPNFNFELINSIYQTGADKPLVVQKLIPSHRVLPS